VGRLRVFIPTVKKELAGKRLREKKRRRRTLVLL
jgi:hypothetical protein